MERPDEPANLKFCHKFNFFRQIVNFNSYVNISLFGWQLTEAQVYLIGGKSFISDYINKIAGHSISFWIIVSIHSITQVFYVYQYGWLHNFHSTSCITACCFNFLFLNIVIELNAGRKKKHEKSRKFLTLERRTVYGEVCTFWMIYLWCNLLCCWLTRHEQNGTSIKNFFEH